MSLSDHPLAERFAQVPEDGIMVRNEGDGFHARVQPSPAIRWGALSLSGGGWAGLCVALAIGVAGPGWNGPQPMVFAGGMLFGLLLAGLHTGRGYLPMEVASSDGQLYFDGDRRPLSQVSGVELRGQSLVVLGPDRVVIGTIDGVSEEVGRWIQETIQHQIANLPRL